MHSLTWASDCDWHLPNGKDSSRSGTPSLRSVGLHHSLAVDSKIDQLQGRIKLTEMYEIFPDLAAANLRRRRTDADQYAC